MVVTITLEDKCMIRETVEVEAKAQDWHTHPGSGKGGEHVHSNINSLTPSECPTVQSDITQN